MDEEDSDQDWDTPKPAKRGKQTGCVIHCTDSNDRLVRPEILESWRSLLAGARRLGNLDILEEANRIDDGEVGEIWYHRRCRSVFLLKKPDQSSSTLTDTPASSSLQASTLS